MNDQEYMERHQGIANKLLMYMLMLQRLYPGGYSCTNETYYGPSITEERHQVGTVQFSIN